MESDDNGDVYVLSTPVGVNQLGNRLIKLNPNLGVIWNINKNGNTWQLNLAKQSRDIWFNGIRNYVVPSYSYKLPESLQKETSRTDDDLV